MTPLQFAAKNDHPGVVEFLLHQGADYSVGGWEQSYLHWGAANGHLRVVEYLVNQKADINEKDRRVGFLYLVGLLFI